MAVQWGLSLNDVYEHVLKWVCAYCERCVRRAHLTNNRMVGRYRQYVSGDIREKLYWAIPDVMLKTSIKMRCVASCPMKRCCHLRCKQFTTRLAKMAQNSSMSAIRLCVADFQYSSSKRRGVNVSIAVTAGSAGGTVAGGIVAPVESREARQETSAHSACSPSKMNALAHSFQPTEYRHLLYRAPKWCK
jgi:hypothetical protein